MRENGRKVVDSLNPEQPSYRAEVERVFGKKPEAVYCFCLLPDFVSIMKANGMADSGAAEPEPLPPEVPTPMKRLCLRGIAEGAISESKAMELLRMSRKALEQELAFKPA